MREIFLDRHQAIKVVIPGLIGDAKTPSAKDLGNPIVAYLGAGTQ